MITTADRGAERLGSLTGLRFAAALLVFSCHATGLGFFPPGVERGLAGYSLAAGYAGVEFFFLLSGFVLAWSVPPGDTRAGFWRRRFVKIYPNHLATWLLALLLALAAGQAVTAGQLVPSLLLVHTWVPDLTVTASLNVPSWSLSCEVLFYALFPWLWAGLRRVPERRLWWCAAGLVLLVVAVPVVVGAVVPSAPAMPGSLLSVPQKWLTMTFPPTRLLEFVLGIVLARLVRSGAWPRVPLPAAAVFAVGCFAAALPLAPTVYGPAAAMLIPLAVLIPAAATADRRGARTGLNSRWLIRLGDYSYAFYLLHYLVLTYLHPFLPDPAVALPATLVLTTVLAAVLHTTLEGPLTRRFGRPDEKAHCSTAARA